MFSFVFNQLLIGDFSLSYEQSKSQFAIWAILAAVSCKFCSHLIDHDFSRQFVPPLVSILKLIEWEI